MSSHLVHELGAYVLGALPDDEEARVREHLARCDECRQEHGRLAGLVPLLDLADATAEVEEPSPLLEESVLDGFRGTTSRPPRRLRLPQWRIAVPSAAAGAALAVAILALAGAFSGEQTQGTTVDLRGAAGSAHATLEAAEAGTVIELDARLPPSGRRDHYEVFMLAGEYEISAGSFRVGDDGRVAVELACGGPPDVYDRIEIRRDGQTVLKSALPA
ncbi:MAG TPA: zf-HC2 domain-containing protein [Solirubrobacteraceae bacterium]